MKIYDILQVFRTHSVTKRTVKGTTQASSPSPIQDTVKISAEAKALQKADAEFQIAQHALRELPAGREDRITEVKNRISTGFYNSQEFVSALSDRLIKNPEVPAAGLTKPTSKTNQLSVEIKNNEIKETKINQVRERIQSGFYNDKSVKNDIAEKLLRNFGV